MRGKIFRGKIRMYFELYVVRNYHLKNNPSKEMEPNFVRRKFPELKNNLQVRGISGANKRREELLDFNVCKGSWACHKDLRRARTPNGYFREVGNGK